MIGKETEFNKLLRNRDVTVEQLRAFVLVLEEGSFTAAAKLLNRTQSTVTQSIHKLESELGIRLINRKQGAKLSFTPAAISFGHEVRNLIADIDNAINRFKSSSKVETLTVGVPEELSIDYITKLSRQLQVGSRFDKVSFIAGSVKELEELVHEERADGIISKEILYGRPEQAVGKVFNYRWAYSGYAHVEDVESLPIVAFSNGSILRDILETSLDSIEKSYFFSYISGSSKNNLAAIKGGLGIGIVSADAAIDQNLFILTEEHGFPKLPACQLRFKPALSMKNKVLINLIEDSLTKIH